MGDAAPERRHCTLQRVQAGAEARRRLMVIHRGDDSEAAAAAGAGAGARFYRRLAASTVAKEPRARPFEDRGGSSSAASERLHARVFRDCKRARPLLLQLLSLVRRNGHK